MVFYWSLRDSKSPQVSRTLLSILAVLNNAVVWMVSTHPQTSKSSSPFNNPLVSVPNAPITIGIIAAFMFHSFFNSLSRSSYLSFFSQTSSFILWSAGTAKSTILQVLFFFLLITIIIIIVVVAVVELLLLLSLLSIFYTSFSQQFQLVWVFVFFIQLFLLKSLQLISEGFADYSLGKNSNWHHCHVNIPQFLNSLARSIYLLNF